MFDESIIQKKFHLEDSEAVSKFAGIAAGIPYGYIQTAEEIISIAHKKLRHRLDRSIHIGLTEHLCCAVERKNQGIELPNALLWEIKNYYPEEYAVGNQELLSGRIRCGNRSPQYYCGKAEHSPLGRRSRIYRHPHRQCGDGEFQFKGLRHRCHDKRYHQYHPVSFPKRSGPQVICV
ncbi:PRD domain-containing protein [Enterocloster clostridioformis]|uniref:PRD domain-containing protein n=1 Tax=Enterocloster clostridioformis TaxID=1531 RepID=A0ABD6LNQ7_9FIRM|nr:PRD domain-containing protein [Enterocloster clostridioformis]